MRQIEMKLNELKVSEEFSDELQKLSLEAGEIEE